MPEPVATPLNIKRSVVVLKAEINFALLRSFGRSAIGLQIWRWLKKCIKQGYILKAPLFRVFFGELLFFMSLKFYLKDHQEAENL